MTPVRPSAPITYSGLAGLQPGRIKVIKEKEGKKKKTFPTNQPPFLVDFSSGIAALD